jgi:hypothetical protein
MNRRWRLGTLQTFAMNRYTSSGRLTEDEWSQAGYATPYLLLLPSLDPLGKAPDSGGTKAGRRQVQRRLLNVASWEGEMCMFGSACVPELAIWVVLVLEIVLVAGSTLL